jgi:hypothetical protein
MIASEFWHRRATSIRFVSALIEQPHQRDILLYFNFFFPEVISSDSSQFFGDLRVELPLHHW